MSRVDGTRAKFTTRFDLPFTGDKLCNGGGDLALLVTLGVRPMAGEGRMRAAAE